MVREFENELFDACSYLDLERIKYALNKGADINSINHNGETPITNAIKFYWATDLDQYKKYSDKEYDAIQKVNYEKLIPIIDYLLDSGADINLYGDGGLPPIVAAYYTNTPELIEYLLQRGANPNVNCYSYEDKLEEDYCSTILSCINELLAEEYDDKAKEIERIVKQYGGRLYHFGYNPIKHEYTGRAFIEIWPTTNSIFFDSAFNRIGNNETLRIEIHENEYVNIDISSVKGWKEWHKEIVDDYYGKKYIKTDKEWDDWFNRGLILAREVKKLLPENVDLYYLYSVKPVFATRKDGSKYWKQTGERILVY